MKKVPEEIYRRIDNDIYNLRETDGGRPDFSLNLIRTLFNPFRVGYAKKIIEQIIQERSKKY